MSCGKVGNSAPKHAVLFTALKGLVEAIQPLTWTLRVISMTTQQNRSDYFCVGSESLRSGLQKQYIGELTQAHMDQHFLTTVKVNLSLCLS